MSREHARRTRLMSYSAASTRTVPLEEGLARHGTALRTVRNRWLTSLNAIANIAPSCVLAHTQIRKIGLKQKKFHFMEIQVNGPIVTDKVCLRLV